MSSPARPAPATAPTSSAGVLAAALAAFGWGLTGIFGTLTYASGLVLTFYRSWLGAGVLAAVVLLAGRRRRFSWALLRAGTLGGLFWAADMTLFFTSVRLTTVAVATVIGALQPALVLVAASPLIGERIGRRQVAWTAVAIAGVAVIVVGGGVPSGNRILGDGLAVGSLVAWSGYFLASKRASAQLAALGCDALDYTAAVTLVGAVGASVVLLASGQSAGRFHAGDWIWIGLLAAVPTVAHLLVNWAHRHLDVSVSSVISSGNPIVAAVGAWIVLGQRLDPLQLVGGAVGLGAIAVIARGAGRGRPSPAAADAGTDAPPAVPAPASSEP